MLQSERVESFLLKSKRGNRFLVTDDNRGSHRAQESDEKLILHFKNGVSFCLEELSVVYFSSIEQILRANC